MHGAIYYYMSVDTMGDMSFHMNGKDDTRKHIKRPLRLRGLPADLRSQIKEARVRRGWGQRELGAKTGLPQPHISAIESGETVPRVNTLLDIVRVLDLDLLLVPRSLVSVVQSLILAQKQPDSVEKPLYAADEEEV